MPAEDKFTHAEPKEGGCVSGCFALFIIGGLVLSALLLLIAPIYGLAGFVLIACIGVIYMAFFEDSKPAAPASPVYPIIRRGEKTLDSDLPEGWRK